MLENERRKLENLDMVLAVVGTMKADKSTTINAIVGAEVLPNRNRPMTALPTLIRHTPGQMQPRLTLEKVQPLTDLLARLRSALAQAAPGILKSLESNDDMAELLAQIRDQRPFETRCEGVDQIFHLLKSLNDLVRLCSKLKHAFPFDEYATVDALPVIEVEFSHLKNATDSPGRFTLLDTPGPNEEDDQKEKYEQPHLKRMLRDQLRKASAVLAVFDYTQLKSEADADVRRELKDIAKIFDGRMYALVNKFDQKTKNSDDGKTVKKIVSSELMDGLIAESHVFPVSSFHGYLANHARHQLALHGKINPDEPWVEDFGKETFGKFWGNQINDPALVKKTTDMLWEDSGFPAPLEKVIVVAHQNAARLALQSTSQKLLDQAENAHQFLQLIIGTSEKSIEELGQSIQAVQASIDSARNIADEVKKSLDEELARMAKTIDEAKGRTLEDAAKELRKYFKEGKRDEEQRKKSASMRDKKSRKGRKQKKTEETGDQNDASDSRPWGWGSTIGRMLGTSDNYGFSNRLFLNKSESDLDFDPDSPVIEFENKSKARDFMKKIQNSIEEILGDAQIQLSKNMGDSMKRFSESMKKQRDEAIAKVRETLNQDLKDFEIDIRTPRFDESSLDFSMSHLLEEHIREKTRTVTRHRRQTGVWGTICGWFNTDDWGWEEYEDDEDYLEVNMTEISNSTQKGLDTLMASAESVVNEEIRPQLENSVEEFFNGFVEKIEHIRADLRAGQQMQERSKEEQTRFVSAASGLKQTALSLKQDGAALVEAVDSFSRQGQAIESRGEWQ